LAGAAALDVHSDAEHDRSVFTLAGKPARFARARGGAREAAARID
jgi:glutamate formiminotransferase